jgi:hypothetical protein
MNSRIECPRCHHTSVRRLYQTQHQVIADIVPDGHKAHVPRFWVFQCECGERFERDVALLDTERQ